MCQDANGCESTASAEITVIINDRPTALASNDGPTCTGNDINIDGGTIPGATYSWSDASGVLSTDEDIVYSQTTAGTYTLTLTVTQNGCTSIATTEAVFAVSYTHLTLPTTSRV